MRLDAHQHFWRYSAAEYGWIGCYAGRVVYVGYAKKVDTDLQARLDRQRAFWKRENLDRPVIGFTGSYFSTDTVEMIGCEQGRVTPDDIVVERILEYSDAQFEAWQDCTGDLFWTATRLYQFRWLAAAVGAAVFAGGDSIWVEPFIEEYVSKMPYFETRSE